MEVETERTKEMEKEQELYEILSSRHEIAIVLMSSQLLWLPAQEKISQNSSTDRRWEAVPRCPFSASGSQPS